MNEYELNTDEATENHERSGLIVESDDLNVGEFYAVLGLKEQPEHPLPISGQSFIVKAINRPFIVGELAVQGGHPPITLDTRLFNFMKVDQDFVKAQLGSVQQQQQENPLELILGSLGQRRRR